MGGNYDFPHTMVTAGGAWPFSGTGEGQKMWGASINRKMKLFAHFSTKNWGVPMAPLALPSPTALFLLLLHHHKHHELHRDSISESSMFEC